METTCWTRGYHLHSKDPMRQVFTSGRDEQGRCKPQIQTQQGRGCGRRGRRRSRGHGTRGRPARRALNEFRSTRKSIIESGPRPWCSDDERARRSQRNAHTRLFPIRVKAKGREEAQRNGSGKDVVRPQFHLITKLLAKRTIVMTRYQPLCTEEDHTKRIFGHDCERHRASDTWVIEKIKEDIARLGYQDVIF